MRRGTGPGIRRRSSFAADFIASALSAFFATFPGVFAVSRNCVLRLSVLIEAPGPRSHETSSASRPFFADQKFSRDPPPDARSSAPTTCVTPRNGLHLVGVEALHERAEDRRMQDHRGVQVLPLHVRARTWPCLRPSRGNRCGAWACRRAVKLFGSLRREPSRAPALFAAALRELAVREPLPAGADDEALLRRARRRASPSTGSRRPCMSIVAPPGAPTVRSCSHEFDIDDEPPVICMPNTVCAYSGAAGASS